MEWLRIPETGTKRWHAVFTTQFGLRFTYCARTVRVGSEIDPMEDTAPSKCKCCQSRIRNPFNVPETIRAIKHGTMPPALPSRQRARRHGEIAMSQGKLYA